MTTRRSEGSAIFAVLALVMALLAAAGIYLQAQPPVPTATQSIQFTQRPDGSVLLDAMQVYNAPGVAKTDGPRRIILGATIPADTLICREAPTSLTCRPIAELWK